MKSEAGGFENFILNLRLHNIMSHFPDTPSDVCTSFHVNLLQLESTGRKHVRSYNISTNMQCDV